MSDEKDEARKRVKEWWNKPEHWFKPDKDGKDERDEQTRDDEIEPEQVA